MIELVPCTWWWMEEDYQYQRDVQIREGGKEALSQKGRIHSQALIVDGNGSQVEEGSDSRMDNGKKGSLPQNSTLVDIFDSRMAEIQCHPRKDNADSVQHHRCLYDKCYLHIAVHGWWK